MRTKRNTQTEFDFQPSTLGITVDYFERYDRISQILDENPKIVELVHKDLAELLENKEEVSGRKCTVSSDTVLRLLICQIIEGESLRGIAIRVDDSNYLRRFVRIYNGGMIDFTTLCTLKNAIHPKTWKKINEVLTKAAVETELVSGEKLRLDTTAVETNIRWPTDSGLLWDTYRVMCRLINTARVIDPESAADRRLQPKLAKRLHTKIARHSGKKGVVSGAVKSLYSQLIRLVEGILEWSPSVSKRLAKGVGEYDTSSMVGGELQARAFSGARVQGGQPGAAENLRWLEGSKRREDFQHLRAPHGAPEARQSFQAHRVRAHGADPTSRRQVHHGLPRIREEARRPHAS